MWKWLVIVGSICLLADSCSFSNQKLSDCLQEAQNNFDTSYATQEKVQPDGSYGISESDRIKIDQNLLQEKANCKVIYN